MRVLHDWDTPHGVGGPAFRRGVQLILFGMSKKIPFLKRLQQVQDVQDEVRDHAHTLAQLDIIAGVDGIFGIADDVEKVYPGMSNLLRFEYKCDVRRHIHVGEISDPNRTRTWEPIDGLENMTSNVWHYDRSYVRGKPRTCKPGEIPVWHVDAPQYLRTYIEFLYYTMIRGVKY